MKNFFLSILCIISISSVLNAQNSTDKLKIGIARVNYIVMKLPEMKEIEAQMKEFENQLQKIYSSKVKAFEDKYSLFISEQTSMTEVVKKNFEIELQKMQESILEYENEAQKSISLKQTRLLQPIQKKVFNSIEKVANQYNYNLILNYDVSGIPIVLHYTDTLDISAMVLSKLGVTDY